MSWLLLVALAFGSLDGQPPRLAVAAEGGVVVTALPPVLDEPAVARHLTTGLTTICVVRVSGSVAGRKVEGGARIEIRYELWDEVFHVVSLSIDGRRVRARLDSLAGLRAWWRTLELTVLAERLAVPVGTRLKVQLDVVPFSAEEQRDAQHWFSETLDQAGRTGTEDVGSSVDDRSEALSRVFNVLLATSIGRRALASFRWTVEAVTGSVP